MLKGGVIMDVVTADQARVAESAGAVAVMALERVPADIRAAGGAGSVGGACGQGRRAGEHRAARKGPVEPWQVACSWARGSGVPRGRVVLSRVKRGGAGQGIEVPMESAPVTGGGAGGAAGG